MLTDRHRWLKIGGLLVALAALCTWYSWQSARQAVGYGLCMEDPSANDGRVVELSLWRVQDVQDGLYLVSKVVRNVPVRGDPRGLEAGDTVSIKGHFDAAGRVIVEDHREVHRLRKLKAGLGALGLLLFVVYAPLRFRWRDGRLTSLG